MKKIILGISSSASIYKSCDLARLFVKNGYDVHTVMTKNAAKLIKPLLLENLTGNRCYTKMFNREQHDMPHISLKENAILLVVAPCSANCIGKFANGIADDLLSTTFLSVSCPIIIAPAMNPTMWENIAVQKNVQTLTERGINISLPVSGKVLCGDEGVGKLAKIARIFEDAVKLIK